MRRIIHLSDIHFGTADHAVVDRAITKINSLEPHLVVVSGDLTQRARTKEFREARGFLDQLPKPQIVVPGNHDIPLHNVYSRLFKALDKFRKFITEDLTPTYIDDEIAVVGINSARSLTIKGGRINSEQTEYIRSKMAGLSKEMLKIIVTHHPFDLPEGFKDNDILGRAAEAMPRIAECGGNVFLSGHLHVSNIDTTAKRYKLANGHVALIVQAGTAFSDRVRGEAHSFNVLEFESPDLRVERYECLTAASGFEAAQHKNYLQNDHGWERVR
ncbi:metallophosphoesterase [soil metagenome]